MKPGTSGNAPFLWKLWTVAGYDETKWRDVLAQYEDTRGERSETEAFGAWLLNIGRWCSKTDLNYWFNALDFDHDGRISPSDMLLGYLVTQASEVGIPSSTRTASSPGKLPYIRLIAIMRYYLRDRDQPRQPVLSEAQFQSLVRDVQKECNMYINFRELTHKMQFPMELGMLAEINKRGLNLDCILSLRQQ